MSEYPSHVIIILAVIAIAPIAHADGPRDAKPRAASLIPDGPPQSDVPPPVITKRAKRIQTHANFGALAMNWTAATGGSPSKMTTFADRQTVLQMFGAGWFATPTLRPTLSVQLAEIAGGAPAGASTFAMASVVPWVAWYPKAPLFLGGGAIIAPRIYGKNQLDLGVFTAAGVAFPLGQGFSAGVSVQVPAMFLVKPAVSVAPASFIAYRF